MSELHIIIGISILVLAAFVLSFYQIFNSNKEFEAKLGQIKVNLADHVQWGAEGKSFLKGIVNGYSIEIEIISFRMTNYGYRIKLHGKFPKQPIFMLSYPKLAPNLEQQGNTLVYTMGVANLDQGLSTSGSVREALKLISSEAKLLEKNAA